MAVAGNPAVVDSFNDFRKLELALTIDLTRLRNIARSFELADLVGEINDVLRAIEQRSFSVAVVGEFKRGKSTLINALLGKEILPADIAPTSATLNRIVYGLKPVVKIVYKGTDEQPGRVEQISIDQLAHYVTKLTPEAERIAAQVQEAIVAYPVPYCQNNVSIIDTPGLNDDPSMTAVTMSVLRQVDAAIFVIMPEAPFAGSEGTFLNSLLANDVGRIIFVVTAIDRIRRPADRERVLDRIRERIKQSLSARAAQEWGDQSAEYQRYMQRVGEPRVYALSGYDALEAKLTGKPETLRASGFETFETALERFVTEERGVVTLKVIADRTASFGEKIEQAILERQNALRLEPGRLQVEERALTDGWTSLRARMEEELRQVDLTAAQAWQRIRPLLDRLPADLAGAAKTPAQTTPLTSDQLNRAILNAVAMYARPGVPDNPPASAKAWFRRAKDGEPRAAPLPDPITDQQVQMMAKVGGIAEFNTAVGRAMFTAGRNLMTNVTVIARYETRKVMAQMQSLATALGAYLEVVERATRHPSVVAPADQSLSLARTLISAAIEAQERLQVYTLTTLETLTTTCLQELKPALLAARQSIPALRVVAREPVAWDSPERLALFRSRYLAVLTPQIVRQIDERNIAQRIQPQVISAFTQLKRNLHSVCADLEALLQPLLEQLHRSNEKRMVLAEHHCASCDESLVDVREIVRRGRDLSSRLDVFASD